MQAINLVTLTFIIAGGLDWGAQALGAEDIIAAMFGPESWLTILVYAIIGVSALWQLVPYLRAVTVGETAAEADLPAGRTGVQ